MVWASTMKCQQFHETILLGMLLLIVISILKTIDSYDHVDRKCSLILSYAQ